MSTTLPQSASLSKPSPTRCPFLGMADDADTWVFQSSYDNLCHRPRRPQPVDLAYQSTTCLSDSHTECPLFQHNGTWTSALPAHIKGTPAPNSRPTIPRSLLLSLGLVGIGLVLSLGVLGIILMNRSSSNTLPDIPLEMSATSLALTSAPQPTIPTPSELAPLSSPIVETRPTLPVLATVEPVIVTLTDEALLYDRPDVESPILISLSAGSQVTILGRDDLANWISVLNSQGLIGWVSADHVDESIHIALLPILESSVGSAALPTLIQEATIVSEPDTIVVELPSRFDILLRYLSFPNNQRCFGNLNLDYTVDITGSGLTLQRQADDVTFRGSYREDTGEFEAEATPSYGREEIFGVIAFDGETVSITGEQFIYYNDRDCTGHWSIAGSVAAESIP